MPRVTTSNEAFKKTEQVVGKPPTTKNDINEEYMRKAPDNLSNNIATVRSGELKDANPSPDEESEERVLGEEALGRQKPAQELAELVENNSVHS